MVNVIDSLIRLRQKQLVAKVFPVCTASSVSVDDTWQYGSVDDIWQYGSVDDTWQYGSVDDTWQYGLSVSVDSTRAYSNSVNVQSFQKVEDGMKWPWDPGGC